MFDEIIKRINALDTWMNNEGVKTEQAHLNKDSREKLYWHYGYLVALKDVLTHLNGQTTIGRIPDKYN